MTEWRLISLAFMVYCLATVCIITALIMVGDYVNQILLTAIGILAAIGGCCIIKRAVEDE